MSTRLSFLPRNKIWLAAALATSLLFSGLVSANAASAETPSAKQEVSSSEYAAFLQDKFDLAFSDAITRGEFIAGLAEAGQWQAADEPVAFQDLSAESPYYEAAKAFYQNGVLASDTVHASDALSAVNAVQFAVRAAGLQELAATYPQAKAEQAIADLPLNPAKLNLPTLQELAAAVDTGLLPASYYGQITPEALVTPELAHLLVGKTLVFRGQYKHYIGYASDADIYAKFTDAYNGSDILQYDKLLEIVDAALEQGLVTGYNLKDSRYDPNFVDELSLVYGHSDLKHALQLIGLLRSEGIDAKVQFEPKTSAFVYLKEWGDPGESDLYVVRQIANGNYIEYAKEYDVSFEFDSVADKQRFNAIVQAYAKKNEDNQAGLIYGSWWQPLYYSLTELPEYEIITNNKIAIDHYYAQSFSLKEQSEAVTEGFKSVDPSVTVENYDFWVDIPFYNYLNGESL